MQSRYLLKSIISTGNIAVGSLGLVVAIAPWFVDIQSLGADKKALVTVIVVLAYFVVILLRALNYAIANLRITPQLVKVLPPPKRYQDESVALLLIAQNSMLYYDSLVSIFHKRENFELLIGYGKVLHIQQDGLMQIIAYDISDRSTVWRDLLSNLNAVKDVIIKPTIQEQLARGLK